jgi:hypothetical protein
LRHFIIIYISKALEKALENPPPVGGVGVVVVIGTNTGPGEGWNWADKVRLPLKGVKFGLGGTYFFNGICIFVINTIKKA